MVSLPRGSVPLDSVRWTTFFFLKCLWVRESFWLISICYRFPGHRSYPLISHLLFSLHRLFLPPFNNFFGRLKLSEMCYEKSLKEKSRCEIKVYDVWPGNWSTDTGEPKTLSDSEILQEEESMADTKRVFYFIRSMRVLYIVI